MKINIMNNELSQRLEACLKKARKKPIEEEKNVNGQLVVSESNGNINKIPAKVL